MIAAVTWIPRGVAASMPTKYEYSKAEQEFLARVAQADGNGQLNGIEEHNGADGEEGEWEDLDQDIGEGENKIVLPKVDLASLPADLRMDEYSDDEDEDGKELGKMLVGKVGSMPCMIDLSLFANLVVIFIEYNSFPCRIYSRPHFDISASSNIGGARHES